nr:pentatricopeptide repeat-containing protein At3g13880 isoform X1 [Tanacetum cinerariifolium]
MYLKSGEFEYAHKVFDEMSQRNVVSWNMLISGYAKTGRYEYAKRVFSEARGMNVGFSKFTYGSVLSVCGKTGDLELGRVVHGMIVVSGVGVSVDVDAFLSNSLVGMYSMCGRVDIARVMFEKCGELDELDEVSWNSMVAGYVKGGLYDEMLRVLVKMHRCGVGFSSYVLGSVLNACCRNFGDSLIWGKLLHSCSVKLGWDLDVVVGTALLDMYGKIGDLNDAISVFGLLRDKNVVMDGLKPSEFTFSTMIRSCIAYKDLEYGKQIHAHVCKNNLQSDEYIGSALIDLYSLCGLMTDSIRCFNSTKKQDIVIWTSVIVGHAQNGEHERALVIFCELLKNELKPDEFTVSTVLSACANLGGVRCGEQIQSYSVKSGIVKSSMVVNSLVYMYAKSGDIDSANQAFDLADKSDVVSWSVMICSTAHHGCAKEALTLFDLMIDMGIAPNDVAFLGVLTACSHGGLVEEGLRYYETMKRDYNITPTEKHCACIVDLFGRAGRLSDAKSFITNSSYSNAPVMWRSLLSSCRIHKNMDIGKQVAKRLIELNPQSSSSYVLLYNIYNDAKMEPQATKIRDLMTNRRIKKEPGLSWIEVGNRVHSFLVMMEGDSLGAFEQQKHKFTKLIFSWSLDDIFKDLYKDKVENIPLTFESEEHYFGSFVYPLLEETRAELASSKEIMYRAPFAEIIYFNESKCGENIVYDVTVGPWKNQFSERGKDAYHTLPGDLLILVDGKLESISDLQRVGRTWALSLIKKLMFAVFVTNITTQMRIWNSLHIHRNLNIVKEVLYSNSMVKESCNICSTCYDSTLSQKYDPRILVNLNESQWAAIMATLCKMPCCHVSFVKQIWGPQGTGNHEVQSASRLLSLVRESFKITIASGDCISPVGDVVLFCTKERLSVSADIEEMYLEHRVKRLVECLGPVTERQQYADEKTEDKGTKSEVKSFIEFVRDRFNSCAPPLRNCILTFCTHIPRSFTGEYIFQKMISFLDNLTSLESLLFQENLVSEELQAHFASKPLEDDLCW